MSDTNRGPIKIILRWQNMNYENDLKTLVTLNIVLYLPFRYGYHNDTC